MFKFLLAFIVWLFATGEYSKWIALVQTSASAGTTSAGSSGTSAAGTSSLSGTLLNGLGALGSLTNGLTANSSASGTSTPADLISGYTGK